MAVLGQQASLCRRGRNSYRHLHRNRTRL